MKRSLSFLLFSAATLFLTACGVTPMTQRTQLVIGNEKVLIRECKKEYDTVVAQYGISQNQDMAAVTHEISNRIIDAAERYFAALGKSERLANFQWEINVLRSDEINAFCYPGGKIAVYEGMFTVVENEDMLATVIGHEVAHALCSHSQEKLGAAGLLSAGGMVLDGILAAKGKSLKTRQMANIGYGFASTFGIFLPHSRKQELEADEIGLNLMAMAGFNPDNAAALWKNMSEAHGGEEGGGFLSTHPKDSKRMAALHAHAETARGYALQFPAGKNAPPAVPDVEELEEYQETEIAFHTPTVFDNTKPGIEGSSSLSAHRTEYSSINDVMYTVQLAFVPKSEAAIQRYSAPEIRNRVRIEATNDRFISVILNKKFTERVDAEKEMRVLRGQGYRDACLLKLEAGEVTETITLR